MEKRSSVIGADQIKRRRRKFKTPEELWKAACEYFEWADSNPILISKAVTHKGEVELVELPKTRPFTVLGFCLFHGLGSGYLRRLRSRIPEVETEYHRVIEHIYNVMWVQKFELAAAGLLNANFIARELGLKDQLSLDAGNVKPAKVVIASREERERMGLSSR